MWPKWESKFFHSLLSFYIGYAPSLINYSMQMITQQILRECAREKKNHCRELSICKTLTDKNSYFTLCTKPPYFVLYKLNWSTAYKTEIRSREQKTQCFDQKNFQRTMGSILILLNISWSICKYAQPEKCPATIEKYFQQRQSFMSSIKYIRKYIFKLT